MIDLAVTVVMLLLVVASSLQPSADRYYVCACFVGCMVACDYLFGGLDGLAYFIIDALSMLGVIVLTSVIKPASKFVLRVHEICLAAILINIIGWVLWFLYYPPIIYNIAFISIYVCTLIAFIKKDDFDDGGGSTINRWCTNFYLNSGPQHHYAKKHESEI